MDFRNIISKTNDFIERGLWNLEENASSKWQRRLLDALRILVMSGKGYFEGRVMVQASALTYYTLLSIVPIIALAFAIAKGFGLESVLTSYIHENLDNGEMAEYLLNFASNTLDNAKGGIIAGAGVAMLLYTVYNLLNKIENVFNVMWCVKKSRPIVRKMTDYLCIMIVAPVLLIISNSATIFLRTLLKDLFPDTFSSFQTFLLNMTPIILMIAVFTLVFLVMPNTKVKFRSAIIAGTITGLAYAGIQWLYITFQVGVSKAGAIYGSFMFLPLFLAWLQIAWTLVLAGCKIAFSIQNMTKYSLEQNVSNVSVEMERKIAILIMHHITTKFVSDSPKSNGLLLCTKLGLPQSFFYRTIDKLKESGLLAELQSENNDARLFIPAIDIALITPNIVLQKLDNIGQKPEFHALHTDEFEMISQTYASIQESGKTNNGNTPLHLMK